MPDQDNQHEHFLRADDGASAAEYALLASLIAVVIIGAVKLFGENTADLFSSVSTAF